MEIETVEVDSEAPGDVADFVEYLEENLPKGREFDCEALLRTVREDEYDEFPGEDIPIRGSEPVTRDVGVEVRFFFEANSDSPNQRLSRLAQEFYDYDYVLHGGFDGKTGEYEGYVFPTVDDE